MQARIINAFAQQAARSGPRQVSMAELATNLGISTKTLYKHFAHKAAIMTALMQSWSVRWTEEQREGFQLNLSPKARIERAVQAWFKNTNQFSASFWQQLERDFPEAHAIYQNEYQAYLERSRQNLTGAIRAELTPDLALSSLMAMMQSVSDTSTCEELGLTRPQALTQVIDLWSRGALTHED